jgi:hypothetical protein
MVDMKDGPSTQFLIWILLQYFPTVDRISVTTLGIVRVATMTLTGTPTATPLTSIKHPLPDIQSLRPYI